MLNGHGKRGITFVLRPRSTVYTDRITICGVTKKKPQISNYTKKNLVLYYIIMAAEKGTSPLANGPARYLLDTYCIDIDLPKKKKK